MYLIRKQRIGIALAAGLVVGLSVGAIDAMAQTPSPKPPAKTVRAVHKTAAMRSSRKTASVKPTPQSPTHRAAVTAPSSLTHEKTHQMQGIGEKSSGSVLLPANNGSNESNPSQPRLPGVK